MLNKELKKFRKQIDVADKKLVKVLSERFKVSKKVGRYKAKYDLPAQDKKREVEMFATRNLWAKKLKVDENLTEQIFKLIIKTVRKKHKDLKNNK